MNDIMNDIMKYCVNYVRNGSNFFLIFYSFFLNICHGYPVRKSGPQTGSQIMRGFALE
jgi:hypothetical protein